MKIRKLCVAAWLFAFASATTISADVVLFSDVEITPAHLGSDGVGGRKFNISFALPDVAVAVGDVLEIRMEFSPATYLELVDYGPDSFEGAGLVLFDNSLGRNGGLNTVELSVDLGNGFTHVSRGATTGRTVSYSDGTYNPIAENTTRIMTGWLVHYRNSGPPGTRAARLDHGRFSIRADYIDIISVPEPSAFTFGWLLTLFIAGMRWWRTVALRTRLSEI